MKMNLHVAFVVFAALAAEVVVAASASRHAPEHVAVESLRALYQRNGPQFVEWAHPDHISEFRQIVLDALERDWKRPNTPSELKTLLGVATIDEARRLAPKEFLARAVSNLGPEARDYSKAKFSIIETTRVDAETIKFLVKIEATAWSSSVETGVVCKRSGRDWKYLRR